MSAATPVPRTIHTGRSKTVALIVALAAVGAIVLVGTFASQTTTSREPRAVAPTSASVLRLLTPAERQQVTAIAALSPAVLRAAFGTDPPVPGLPAGQRRFVLGLAAMTQAQLAAAHGPGH